jgi:hypothetical protein
MVIQWDLRCCKVSSKVPGKVTPGIRNLLNAIPTQSDGRADGNSRDHQPDYLRHRAVRPVIFAPALILQGSKLGMAIMVTFK